MPRELVAHFQATNVQATYPFLIIKLHLLKIVLLKLSPENLGYLAQGIEGSSLLTETLLT